MKKIYIMHLDQNQVKHLPMVFFDSTYDDLCGLEKDFRKSKGLKDCFDDPQVKEIVIAIYVPKGETAQRRRIAGVKEDMSIDQAKTLCEQMANDLQIHLTWHSNAEFQKLFPMKKQDRELLKMMFGSGKSLPVT